MTLEDFIDEAEICTITGWSKKTMRNIRYADHTFPEKCKGKTVRFLRRDFMCWYTNKSKVTRKAS